MTDGPVEDGGPGLPFVALATITPQQLIAGTRAATRRSRLWVSAAVFLLVLGVIVLRNWFYLLLAVALCARWWWLQPRLIY